MRKHQMTLLTLASILFLFCLVGCGRLGSDAESASQAPASADTTAVSENTTNDSETERPANWTEATHSKEADPDYEAVFPQDEVNQITITIAPEDWAAMQANMTELYGEAGTGDNVGRPPAGDGDFQPPGDGNFPESADGERPEPPQGGPPGEPPAEGVPPGQPPAGGGFGPGGMATENPMWVEATIEFDGYTWTHVGVRYKGNSSLMSSWRQGTLKLPLKLDFDEFEDTYQEIDDQRFYGFKQLSLANGFGDASFLRDATTYDILEEAGLPAAETAFYEVVVDYGEGQQSLGLYVMIEVIDDTVVERTFGSDSGNIYEADGMAANLATSTYNQIEESFKKENNKDEADWSDIEALHEVLHSEQRTTNPAAWRESLEALFDVDNFLEWLAISAAIEHWDTYGSIAHNYYLYNNPDTGQLTWISWDHNGTMSTGARRVNQAGGPDANQAGGPGGNQAGGPNRTVSLDKEEVTDNWPLIRYLMDDPVYYDIYLAYLAETVAGPFNPDQMAEKYQAMADLIRPYATADVGEGVFDTAVQQLIDFTYQRADEVDTFLSSTE